MGGYRRADTPYRRGLYCGSPMVKTCPSYLRVLIGAFCSALLFSPAGAGPNDAAHEITRLETLYSQSFVTGDEHVAERLLVDDFIGFGSNGKPWDKKAMLSEVRSLPHQASARITSIEVRVHGDSAVVLEQRMMEVRLQRRFCIAAGSTRGYGQEKAGAWWDQRRFRAHIDTTTTVRRLKLTIEVNYIGDGAKRRVAIILPDQSELAVSRLS